MQQTAESVWKKCLRFVEDNIDPQAFKTWFNPIVPVKLKDNALNVEVPSKFFYEWIEEHYIKIPRKYFFGLSSHTFSLSSDIPPHDFEYLVSQILFL